MQKHGTLQFYVKKISFSWSISPNSSLGRTFLTPYKLRYMVGPNHVRATASEAEWVLQMLVYNREKKACNWDKYVAQHVKYHIFVKNLMEYGYQGLSPRSKL